MKIGDVFLDLSTPVVMTILNVTPDSFFAGSRRRTDEDIIRAAGEAVSEGAAIIDVGGYSSRPGAAEVEPEEEFRRLARGVGIIRERYPQTAVSIDTFRAVVAERIIREFGACIINDISAGDLDGGMIGVAARTGVPYIAMHMRGDPATMQMHTDYGDIAGEVKDFFAAKIAELKNKGIDNIIIDPGFGFAKTTRQNHRLLHRMDELLTFGYPVLSGISRKSMIYKVLDITPEESLTGTAALNWESLSKGASILRVHDTKEAVQIVKLFSYYRNA